MGLVSLSVFPMLVYTGNLSLASDLGAISPISRVCFGNGPDTCLLKGKHDVLLGEWGSRAMYSVYIYCDISVTVLFLFLFVLFSVTDF